MFKKSMLTAVFTATSLSVSLFPAHAVVNRNGIDYDRCVGNQCTVTSCMGDTCIQRTDYFVLDANGNWTLISSQEKIVNKRPVLQ